VVKLNSGVSITAVELLNQIMGVSASVSYFECQTVAKAGMHPGHCLVMMRAPGAGDASTENQMKKKIEDAGTKARWIPSPTCDILKTCRQGSDIRDKTGAHFNA
jgi:hypothetical protein